MRYVLFDIRDLAALRAALAHLPGPADTRQRFADLAEVRPGDLPDLAALSGSRDTPAWLWRGTAADLASGDGEALRRFVFPLTHGALPFCLAFPFPAADLAPRSLTLQDRSLLDLEDVGRLLAEAAVAPRPPDSAPNAGGPRDGRTAASPSAARPGCPAAAAHVQADLDAAQRAAVTHGGGALRVLAPAGSGKTKTMINRAAALVAGGVRPGSVLVLAFNTKAAEQLEERLSGLGVPTTRRLGDTCGVHCATFNAFGFRYQRDVAGLAPEVSADAALQERLMRAAVWRCLHGGGPAPPDEGWAGAALDDLVWHALQALVLVRADCRPAETLELTVPEGLRADGRVGVSFAAVRAAYAAEQRRRGLQDFDDQVYATVSDLLAHPARRRSMQERFSHILVDEFQDLNEAQLSLVDILSRPHRDLFVVGDDDQLIYGWRFARVGNLLDFERRMPAAPHCASVLLGTNYRCSQAVVQRSLRLIGQNRRRVVKQIVCGPRAASGSVVFFVSPSWPARAATLGAYLADLRLADGCPWNDLAVLCRYRCQQPLVAAALRSAGVPHSIPAGARLFSLPAASVVRSCLGLAAAAARRRSLPPAELGRAAARLRLTPSVLESRLAALARWQREERPTAARALTAVAGELGLEAALGAGARLDAHRRDAAEEGGPARLLEAALLLSLDHQDLDGFLHQWDAWAAQETSPVGSDRLSAETDEGRRCGPIAQEGAIVSTIHAAKGREYEHVVVADYSADVDALDEAGAEEERRVLYVALTRARRSVLLTVDTRKHAPHPFLRELASPPSREQARALRRELTRVEAALADVEDAARRSHSAGAPRTTRPTTADVGARAASLRLRRLELAGRLTERRLVAPRSRLASVAAMLGVEPDRAL